MCVCVCGLVKYFWQVGNKIEIVPLVIDIINII